MTVLASILFPGDRSPIGRTGRRHPWLQAATALTLAWISMAPAMADSLARSTGKMDVVATTNIFLPVTALGDACLTADAGGISAPGIAYDGNLGAAAACRNALLVKSPRQSSIFYTLFDLKTYHGYEGATGLAKFPAPVFGDAGLKVIAGPVGKDTLAEASGVFDTTETSVGGVVLKRNVTMQSAAEVTQKSAMSPPGIATSRTYDPWFFFPVSDTQLTLQITLHDIELIARSDPGETSAAIFDAFGAFGRGSVPGVDVLRTWGSDIFLGATDNNTFNLSRRTIFDISGDPILLLAGETYWLTAATQAGAGAVEVPEPSAVSLLGVGLIALLVGRRRRAEFSHF